METVWLELFLKPKICFFKNKYLDIVGFCSLAHVANTLIFSKLELNGLAIPIYRNWPVLSESYTNLMKQDCSYQSEALNVLTAF